MPRRLRLRLRDLQAFKWALPACVCITLPVADILNRFVAAFFVFILGMSSYPFNLWERMRSAHVIGGLTSTNQGSQPESPGQRRPPVTFAMERNEKLLYQNSGLRSIETFFRGQGR